MPSDIVIFGDLILDWVCNENLPFSFNEIVSDSHIWTTILELPGGTAYNAAKFSADFGLATSVIGKVGKDRGGEIILKALAELKVDINAIKRDNSLGTGRIFMARDNSSRKTRLTVVNYPNANINLSFSDVKEAENLIKTAKMVFLSGFCVADNNVPRFEAAIEAIRLAGASLHTKVVFDVVPHKIYEKYSFEKYLEILKEVDILVAEVATVRRFLHKGDRYESISDDDVADTVASLRMYFPNFILRYGYHNASKQVIVRQSEIFYSETNYLQAADTRGFSEYLTIAALKKYFF